MSRDEAARRENGATVSKGAAESRRGKSGVENAFKTTSPSAHRRGEKRQTDPGAAGDRASTQSGPKGEETECRFSFIFLPLLQQTFFWPLSQQ
jgi:hypothetical protein